MAEYISVVLSVPICGTELGQRQESNHKGRTSPGPAGSRRQPPASVGDWSKPALALPESRYGREVPSARGCVLGSSTRRHQNLKISFQSEESQRPGLEDGYSGIDFRPGPTTVADGEAGEGEGERKKGVKQNPWDVGDWYTHPGTTND